jgi:hypothetical protein
MRTCAIVLEIDPKRQAKLAQCQAITPDIEQGIYPFKGMKLSRADVEWLLVHLSTILKLVLIGGSSCKPIMYTSMNCPCR